MADDGNKWTRPSNPPPPLFLGEKERNLVKQVNDELLERVIGQQIAYIPVSMEFTNYHPLYGEAIEKCFLPPVRVYTLVEFDPIITQTQNYGLDKENVINVKFHKRRLLEDQDLYVREGDYVLYGNRFYEIVSLSDGRQLFGQVDHLFEIQAKCIKTRKGLIDLDTLAPAAYSSALSAGSLVSPEGPDGGGAGGGGGGGGGGPAVAAKVVFTAEQEGAPAPGILATTIPGGSSLNDLFGISGEIEYTTIMIFVNGLLQSVSDAPAESDFYVNESGELISNFPIVAGSNLTVVFLTALSGVF